MRLGSKSYPAAPVGVELPMSVILALGGHNSGCIIRAASRPGLLDQETGCGKCEKVKTVTHTINSFSCLICRDSVVPTKLYVGNLPETVRKADLQQMFEGFGKVLECDIVLNYAFVVGFSSVREMFTV